MAIVVAATNPNIPNNAIGEDELADDAVDTAAIQDDSVTEEKLAFDLEGLIDSKVLAETEARASDVADLQMADNAINIAMAALETALATKVALTEKNAVGGVADLPGGLLRDSVIPAAIARDAEVDAKVLAEANARDAAIAAAVAQAKADLTGAAPSVLDTFVEFAAALNNDPGFANTIAAQLAGKQASSANLAALSNLVFAANRMIYGTGAGTVGMTDLTPFARQILDDLDAPSVRTTLGLGSAATNPSSAFDAAGSAATAQAAAIAASQPASVLLSALAALAPVNNQMPYYGAGAWSVTDITAQARQLLDDASFAAMRTTLGLGSAAVANLSDFDAAGTATAAVAAEVTARDAAIAQAKNDILGGAGAAGDTLKELQDLIASDEAGLASLVAQMAGKQALNGVLTALSALAMAQNKLPYFDSNGTAATADLTAFARTLLDDANAAAARGTLGLGTAALNATGDFDAAGAAATAQANAIAASQPLAQRLTDIVALALGNNQGIYKNNAGAIAVFDLSAAGRALIDDNDATAQRTTLGLGTAAVQNVGAFEASGAVATETTARQLADAAYDSINAYTVNTTLSAADLRCLVRMNAAGALTLSIPTDATWNAPVGTHIDFSQAGAGQVTVSAVTPGTTTVVSAGATTASPKTRGQYSAGTIVKLGANSWAVYGDVV